MFIYVVGLEECFNFESIIIEIFELVVVELLIVDLVCEFFVYNFLVQFDGEINIYDWQFLGGILFFFMVMDLGIINYVVLGSFFVIIMVDGVCESVVDIIEVVVQENVDIMIEVIFDFLCVGFSFDILVVNSLGG